MIRVSAGKHGRRRRVQVRSTCSFDRLGDYQPIKERETLYAFSFACYFSIRRVSPGSPEFEPPTGGSSNQGSHLLTQPDLQPDVFRFNRASVSNPFRGAFGNFNDVRVTCTLASSRHFQVNPAKWRDGIPAPVAQGAGRIQMSFEKTSFNSGPQR